MFGIGMPELVIIFVIALLVFGPKELPKIGKTIGRAMGEFRRASDELKDGIQREIDMAEREQSEVTPSSEVTVPTAAEEFPVETSTTAKPAPEPQLELPIEQRTATATPPDEVPRIEPAAGTDVPPAAPVTPAANDAPAGIGSPEKTPAPQVAETKHV